MAEDINNHYFFMHGLDEEEDDDHKSYHYAVSMMFLIIFSLVTVSVSLSNFPLTPPSSQHPAEESWQQDNSYSFVHNPDEDLLTILVNPHAFSPPVRNVPIGQDNSHERRSTECVGVGEAISNVTLEPKP
ncbi:hypothetical protein EDD85DRAFT_950980 [Armillaria nabsnona]|nr:hypothetical protein EDD85DRAFT_950980 [Armillaria nabsnona]